MSEYLSIYPIWGILGFFDPDIPKLPAGASENW
jgi:hypothetical protein